MQGDDVNTMATFNEHTADTERRRLTEQLASAWSTARPWDEPPAGWLDTAVTALSANADQGNEEPDRVDASDLARWRYTVGRLRQLRSETRHHACVAVTRRRELTLLRDQVRQRAIDQLDDSPELEESLRDALADWGLAPISDDDSENDEDGDGDT